MLFLDCNPVELGVIVKLVKTALWLIQLAAPIILIIVGTLDLLKGVYTSDDKVQKAVVQTFGKRVVYAIGIFLVTLVVTLVMNIVANTTSNENAEGRATDFLSCWNDVSK